MKPIIAVSATIDDDRIVAMRDNTQSVLGAGGIPIVVPYISDMADIERICAKSDGLLLTGGSDVDPSLYGEEPMVGLGAVSPERDRLELLLIRAFMDAGKPILAICRGVQVLNAAAGGTLYQDIERQVAAPLQHRQNAPRSHMSHTVTVLEGSLLHAVTGEAGFKVNTFHHQAVKEVAPGFRAAAWSKDGVIEAIEWTSDELGGRSAGFVLGVQWHPENTTAVDPISRKLFAGFIKACCAQA